MATDRADVLSTDDAGLDVMTARVEHADPGVAVRVAQEIRTRCEVRAEVEVLATGTLPKTEFKAKRVRDLRRATRTSRTSSPPSAPAWGACSSAANSSPEAT